MKKKETDILHSLFSYLPTHAGIKVVVCWRSLDVEKR
jgi:hypothetical protein